MNGRLIRRVAAGLTTVLLFLSPSMIGAAGSAASARGICRPAYCRTFHR